MQPDVLIHVAGPWKRKVRCRTRNQPFDRINKQQVKDVIFENLGHSERKLKTAEYLFNALLL